MTNILKKAVIGVAILTLSQTAVSQESNTDKEPKKSAAIIKEGYASDAKKYSVIHKDIFVLQIFGGTVGINGEPQEAYTAKQYAELLQKEFAKHGQQIAVYYHEYTLYTKPTYVDVYKDGYIYNLESETFSPIPFLHSQFFENSSIYHPFLLFKEIPKIIKYYSGVLNVARIMEGDAGSASTYSIRNKDIFVLFVSGGARGINGEQHEAYTAKTYAELLQKEFAKYGEDIAVFFEESGKDRPTGVLVWKGGRIYDRNSESFTVSPENALYHPFILHGEISKIVKGHAVQTNRP
jgi:hypothetical protein